MNAGSISCPRNFKRGISLLYHGCYRSNHGINTKYSTLPCGILVYIAQKVGIFSETEGRGKYSLPRVPYIPAFHKVVL